MQCLGKHLRMDIPIGIGKILVHAKYWVLRMYQPSILRITINSLGKPRRQMVPRDALFLCEKPLPRCSLQLPSNKSTRLYQLVTDLHLSKAMRARLLVSFSRLRLANHCFHWTLHIVYPEYIHQEIQGVSPTSVVGDPWNPGRRLPTSYMLSRGLR